MSRLRVVTLVLTVLATAAAAVAQTVRGVVVDQTGLAVPGATVQVFDGLVLVTSLTTGGDGTFLIDASTVGGTVAVSLEGFETARVARDDASRVVLTIARAKDVTTVVAPVAAESSPTAALLGNTITATNIARLPSSRMRARESLPLLPSVVRGPDGLMRLGGAQAHDTPLLLDGFNITDPATGVSSLNLPFEAVRGVEVLRDPMSVSYGGLLGGIVKMESTPGADRLTRGVQGIIPRPRFANPGFGRLEGIFPRAFVSGSSKGGRFRMFLGGEYDYERIPIPEVTGRTGPDMIEDSAIFFTRVDAQLSARHNMTIEAFAFPSRTRSYGLSPRRDETATADITGQNLFAGITHRFVANQSSVLTIQLGALSYESRLSPNGQGLAFLTPSGWQNNWFAAVERTAVRYNALVSWERIRTIAGKTHDFTTSAEVAASRLSGTIDEHGLVVEDESNNVVRTVDFGPEARIHSHDLPAAISFRDVWHATDRVQVDGGLRADHSRFGHWRPSARAGLRYELTSTGTTVLKAGAGRFVGNLPLLVPAYADYAPRTERRFDPVDGSVTRVTTMTPTVGPLSLPVANAFTLGVEQQIRPRLDAQVSTTIRNSSGLATLRVPSTSGPITVESTGTGTYRELQVSVRRTWPGDQQVFLSYVRSSSSGELNDFSAAFRALAVPLVQPGGLSRLSTDAPNRVIVWGTFNLPRRVVVSPVAEWRSGFPYSALDPSYAYAGAPNDRTYPAFFSTDMVIYKTVTVKKRSADVGIQLFNVTNHKNPRDVYAVVGAPRYGEFTNSVGTIVRGYMLFKW